MWKPDGTDSERFWVPDLGLGRKHIPEISHISSYRVQTATLKGKCLSQRLLQ